ncbi:hypothetical protein ON010_g391 [Phytophthora cinnamomi]|nr:hypothetical protein ON010_g391 [Phytophthora cinnamomi]
MSKPRFNTMNDESAPTSVNLEQRELEHNTKQNASDLMPSPQERFIKAWERTQVELHGSYSTDRVLALAQYTREKSWTHIIMVLLVSPLPCLIITVLSDVLPLDAPAEGIKANKMFQVRQFYSYVVMSFLCAQQFRTSVRALPYPNLNVVRDTVVVAALMAAVLYGVGRDHHGGHGDRVAPADPTESGNRNHGVEHHQGVAVRGVASGYLSSILLRVHDIIQDRSDVLCVAATGDQAGHAEHLHADGGALERRDARGGGFQLGGVQRVVCVVLHAKLTVIWDNADGDGSTFGAVGDVAPRLPKSSTGVHLATCLERAEMMLLDQQEALQMHGAKSIRGPSTSQQNQLTETHAAKDQDFNIESPATMRHGAAGARIHPAPERPTRESEPKEITAISLHNLHGCHVQTAQPTLLRSTGGLDTERTYPSAAEGHVQLLAQARFIAVAVHRAAVPTSILSYSTTSFRPGKTVAGCTDQNLLLGLLQCAGFARAPWFRLHF